MKAKLLLVCLPLTGCAHMYVTPEDKNYFTNYPYVGQEVTLKRHQELCDVRNDISYRAFRKTKLDPHGSCVTAPIPLEAGTPIFIEEVRPDFVPMNGNSWYALGHVTLDGKIYSFEYKFASSYERAKFPPPWVEK